MARTRKEAEKLLTEARDLLRLFTVTDDGEERNNDEEFVLWERINAYFKEPEDAKP